MYSQHKKFGFMVFIGRALLGRESHAAHEKVQFGQVASFPRTSIDRAAVIPRVKSDGPGRLR